MDRQAGMTYRPSGSADCKIPGRGVMAPGKTLYLANPYGFSDSSAPGRC